MKADDIKVKYKLNPKTIKNLENFKGVVVIGVGRSSGMIAIRETISKMTFNAIPLMIEEVDMVKLVKDLESHMSRNEEIRNLTAELDLVSQFGIPPDMIEDIDNKMFVESPSQDFNVKGQSPIWMKGMKR